MGRRHFMLVVMVSGVLLWGLALSSASAVTQGEYAVELAKRFNDICGCRPSVCDGSDPSACAEGLARLGIEPPGGWRLSDPMTDSDIADVTDDVILAAKDGKLGTCTPQRAVDMVAATSIALGLSGRDVYLTAYQRLGYYFPPTIPSVGGSGGGTVVSPSQ